jgi:hypothetical protein
MKTNFFFPKRSLLLALLAIFCYSLTVKSQVQYTGTINSGNSATAINFETQATGDYSLAAGYQSIASGQASIALGYQANALGTHSFAIGELCEANSGQCYAFGRGVKLIANQSFGFGFYVEGWANNTMTFGFNDMGYPLINGISNSIMFGIKSTRPTLFISESESTFNRDGLGKVGIGTSSPIARLQVAEGDIFLEDINYGIVMKSPNGNCWRGKLNNEGILEFEQLENCETLTGIDKPQSKAETSFQIFPNPTKNYLDINCSQSDCGNYTSIALTDMAGKILFTIPLTTTSTRLSLNNVDSGTYIIKISGQHGCYAEKVIVE